jgi:hypothetical protein
VSGTSWGVAALLLGLAGGAIQLAQRRPAPEAQQTEAAR